jgi:hypothetical protein
MIEGGAAGIVYRIKDFTTSSPRHVSRLRHPSALKSPEACRSKVRKLFSRLEGVGA